MKSKVYDRIREMHRTPHYHKKRGFMLGKVSESMVACHLVEESVELLAEVIQGNPEGVREEASDVYALVMHTLKTLNITLEEIEEITLKKLNDAFTTDQQEVITNTPGATRRNRNE